MSRKLIEDCVRESLQGYLQDLQDADPHGVYDMIIEAAEKPLLEVILAHAKGNQSLAADWLGIHRNTLRRKLQAHRLLT